MDDDWKCEVCGEDVESVSDEMLCEQCQQEDEEDAEPQRQLRADYQASVL